MKRMEAKCQKQDEQLRRNRARQIAKEALEPSCEESGPPEAPSTEEGLEAVAEGIETLSLITFEDGLERARLLEWATFQIPASRRLLIYSESIYAKPTARGPPRLRSSQGVRW
jgi:hypothetical protein